MGTLAGFVVGYVVGMKQGPEHYAKLRQATESILGSPEVKDLLQRLPQLGDRLQGSGDGVDGGNGVGVQLKDLLGRKEELGAALRSIAQSETVQAVVAGGLQLAGSVVERGMSLLAVEPKARQEPR